MPTEKPRVQKRLWLCVRIVDYRLQALAPTDGDDPEGEQDWCDVGADTTLSADREAMFQLARLHQGLLMGFNGLPAAGRLAALAARAKALAAQ